MPISVGFAPAPAATRAIFAPHPRRGALSARRVPWTCKRSSPRGPPPGVRPVLRWFRALSRRRARAAQAEPAALKDMLRSSAHLLAIGLAIWRTASVPTLTAVPRRVPANWAAWWVPCVEAFTIVCASAFGDKSWFAIALLAMKHQALAVLVGALSSLTVMTCIACFLGKLINFLPTRLTHYMSIALFLIFGFQMLLQARKLPSSGAAQSTGERQEAEGMVQELKTSEKQHPGLVIGKISSLIFFAEFGDRSMISTMILAASTGRMSAVVAGATAANFLTSGVAVAGASIVASRVSERMVAIIAGLLFQLFAVHSFLEGP